MRPSLVCFDLGGVLVRICRSWAEGCAAAGLPLRVEIDLESRPAVAELHRQHQTGVLDGAEYACRLSDHLERLYSPEEIMSIHDAWMLGQYSGVETIIQRLHENELRTAALSNTNHEHWQRMPEFTAVTILQHRLASHELGLVKPDPQIYRELERRLDVESVEILFFDDLEANVDTARRVGWQAVLIDPLRETAPQIIEGLARHGVHISLDRDPIT